MKHLLLSLTLLLGGCKLFQPRPQPAVPTIKAGQTTPLADATIKADDAGRIVEDKADERDAKVKANIEAAHKQIPNFPDSPPKFIVDAELSIATLRLDHVKADSLEIIASEKRRVAFEAGKAEEARKMVGIASNEARQATEEIGKLKLERDSAIEARKQAERDLETKLEENRKANQKILDDLKHEYEKKLQEERDNLQRYVVRGLYGLGALLILIGAVVAYFGAQAGNVFTGITKASVFLCFAIFCFVSAWVIGQPWFKWFVIGGITLGVIGVLVYLWSEKQDSKKAKILDKECTEAESTLTKVAEVIHELPEDDGIFNKLGRKLNDNEKALILELRALAKRPESK